MYPNYPCYLLHGRVSGLAWRRSLGRILLLCPGAVPPFQHDGIGCPTFRGFRKVGTTGLGAVFIRSFRFAPGSGARALLPHEIP